MLQKNDIRCGQCCRKLATGHYIELQIKCPRCGTLRPRASYLSAIERLISQEMTMSDTPSIEHAPTWLQLEAGSATRWQEG